MQKLIGLLAVLSVSISAGAQTARYRHDQKWLLPDATISPGVVRTTDSSELCAKGFTTRTYRHTTEATKKQVCREYGAQDCPNFKKGEIDHLIPLELGGADQIRDLWWQPAPQYRVKDKLENYLHRLVCTGKMTLPAAQQCISTDWAKCAGNVGLRGLGK